MNLQGKIQDFSWNYKNGSMFPLRKRDKLRTATLRIKYPIRQNLVRLPF
uniref:Uncharacterized protein n=1 Tax=Anguilla anguilla TaxID=7936 RepID=A0A0E9WR16_ANGAN